MPQTHKENQEGLNEGYYTHCSFRSATQPVPAETNPRSVLNRLFGKTDQPGQLANVDPLDRRMLDLVLDGAKDLRRNSRMSTNRNWMNTLTVCVPSSVGLLPSNIGKKEAALEKAGVASSKRNESDSPPIEIKIPMGDKRSEYMQVMCDLNVLAFRPTLLA